MKMDKVLLPFIVLFFISTLVFNATSRANHFSLLAQSFLKGKVYFLEKPNSSWLDTTPFGERNYSPHPPFPAIVLTPFVYFFNFLGLEFYSGYLQILLVPAIFLMVFKIAKLVGYNRNDSLYLSFAYCFSTAFLGIALWPNFIAYTSATIFLFIMIFSYLRNFSPVLLVGISGILFLTRAPTLLSATFPIFCLLSNKRIKVSKKYKRLVKMLILLLLSFSLFGFYNWLRFRDFFEFGYTNTVNLEPFERAREYGVLSLIHLPGNIYYLLFSAPLPIFKDSVSSVLKFPFIRANPMGMSIFITSPMFFYLFFLSYKDRLSKTLIVTVLAISFPILLYYGIGFRQFGYRYSLDFLPFLFFLLIKNYKQKFKSLSLGFKMLILFSSVTNYYFFITAYLYT